MAALGLVPGEESTGDKVKRLSITKTGNAHVRRVVVEAAWQYQRVIRSGARIKQRRKGQAADLIAIADKCEDRLHRRFVRLTSRGKRSTVAAVAVARELAGFIYLPSFGVEVSFFDPWRPFGAGDADLVHIFAANIGTYHLAREIHALGIPLVVSPIIYTGHSHAFGRTSLGVTRLAQRAGRGIWSDYAFAADICSWADHLVPNTRREADLVAEGLGMPREKITVVPNGVDARFASGDPSLFEIRFGLRDFILTVGHTGHERKNVLALIRALGGIDHPAVIVGRIIRSPYGDACVTEARKHPHITLIDGLSNRTCTHRKNISHYSADTSRRTLIRFNRRWMIVTFDFKCYC